MGEKKFCAWPDGELPPILVAPRLEEDPSAGARRVRFSPGGCQGAFLFVIFGPESSGCSSIQPVT
jgi:hypothetical protein